MIFITIILAILVCLLIMYYYTEKLKKTQVRHSVKEQLLEQEKAELIREKAFLKYLWGISNKIDVSVIQLNVDGDIKYFNSMFKKQFVNSCDDFYKIDTYDQTLQNFIKNALLVGEIRQELQYKNKFYDIKIIPLVDIEDERRSGTILQFYDITFLKEYDMLQKQLFANISHELKNPLTSIILATDALAREQESELVDILREETSRVKIILDDMLMLSKMQAKKNDEFELFNFSELCQTYTKLVKLQNGKLILDVADNLYLKGEKALVERLIINLLNNALKYSDDKIITLELKESATQIILKVSDDGIGIAPQNLERIFERFYRVDESRARDSGGSGLGLSIVKEIVMLHHGKIEVESKLQQGTTFKISFPK